MKDTLVRPGARKERISHRPSQGEASDNPLASFFVPSSDGIGRSITLSTGCPPDMRRIATVIRESKIFPFKTEQDVVRYAILVGLRKLEELSKDKKVNATVSAFESWQRVAADEMEMMTYDDHLRMVERTVGIMIQRGYYDRALLFLDKVWRESDRLDDQYWAKLYRTKTKKLLDRVKKEIEKKRKAEMEGDDDE